ncbi:hypothetical protein [Timonella senegalensis]|uniref:hypothetical protein n=1 Tax=Timonella senegalensis TaxID=1465825 RepID=UPI0005932D48|nr:hypothetical protein [Timonella senegalensis]
MALGVAGLLTIVGVIAAVVSWKAIMPAGRGDTEAMWVDHSSEVTVVRNPSIMSDAVLYNGSFSVGQDGCLYVTVLEEEETTYLAATNPSATINQDAVSDRGISYKMGDTAWFSKAVLRGQLPSKGLSMCQGASEVFGVSLAATPDP